MRLAWNMSWSTDPSSSAKVNIPAREQVESFTDPDLKKRTAHSESGIAHNITSDTLDIYSYLADILHEMPSPNIPGVITDRPEVPRVGSEALLAAFRTAQLACTPHLAAVLLPDPFRHP